MFKRTIFLMREQIKRTNHLLALNVAEKPSVARTISNLLSNHSAVKLESSSTYNPIFNFEYKNLKNNYLMNFTSVVGHLMNFVFEKDYKKWDLETSKKLYQAKIVKEIKEGNENVAYNLKNLAKDSNLLILWLDCDREGENIAYEVIEVVKQANPQIQILRAKFSALTEKDIIYSIENLEEPNKNLSDAVDLRQKIDLIIGASFTRLQTICFQNILNILKTKQNYKSIISYGPCQFPTLNFIVERADKIENFKQEDFHYLELIVCKSDASKENSISTTFNWTRERLFDKEIVTSIEEKLNSNPTVEIIEVVNNSKTRLKPIPLNTIEMQKLISKRLKIFSDQVMEIAEKLYQKGYISYPRTETQKYSPNEIPYLKRIFEEISRGEGYKWCDYAKNLLEEKKFYKPRDGKLDDKAHPPIHPVKFVKPENLSDQERKIYETICVHFLATVSLDAKGDETVIKAILDEEIFIAKGVRITKKGYLEVYPFDNWNEIEIANFSVGDKFILNKNANLLNKKGNTTPPNHLTESELITLMDKHGIGTDSTIHEHIKNIKERGYAYQQGSFLKPHILGNALIKAYKNIGVELYKPYLRAAMEKDIIKVCEGSKNAEKIFIEMKNEMEKIFDTVSEKIPVMREYLIDFLKLKRIKYLEEVSNSKNSSDSINGKIIFKKKEILNIDKLDDIKIPVKCPECGENEMRIVENPKTRKFFIGCCGYPNCKHTMSINNPSAIHETKEICKKCSSPFYELEYEGKKNQIKCLAECFLSGSHVKNDNKNIKKYNRDEYSNVHNKKKFNQNLKTNDYKTKYSGSIKKNGKKASDNNGRFLV